MSVTAKRANDLLRNFCISLNEHLDDPILQYLTQMLIEMAKDEQKCETVAETMNVYFSQTVTADDVVQLKGILLSREEVLSFAETPFLQSAEIASKLNATAAEFVPQQIYGQSEKEDPVERLDIWLQEPSNNPLELLSSFFPDMPLSELQTVYKSNDECFAWTLDALSMMQAGFETVVRKKKREAKMSNDQKTSQMTLFQMDWSAENFPELPGQSGKVPASPTQDCKMTFRDVAKKNRPPPSSFSDKPPPQRSASARTLRPRRTKSTTDASITESPLKTRSNSEKAIPWVVTGEAVSKQYAKLRADAIEYAKLRNACFREATLAYVSGNKALAKQLGKEGRKWGAEMKRCHDEASESIFRSRNACLKSKLPADGPDVIDLHGLHVAEARRILARELESFANTKIRPRQQRVIHLIVGTGHHTKGARTPSRLPTAVQDFLRDEGYTFRKSRPGALEVYI